MRCFHVANGTDSHWRFKRGNDNVLSHVVSGTDCRRGIETRNVLRDVTAGIDSQKSLRQEILVIFRNV